MNKRVEQFKSSETLPAETKRCSICTNIFLIETHFQSSRKSESTKTCKLCRNQSIKWKNNPTSVEQKRRTIYLTHKRKEIEKSRGCQWSRCRFNFSDKPETFLVCENVQNLVIFEFDHLQEKLFNVSCWGQIRKCTEQDLIDEISKCRILCSFHHRIHSQNQITEKRNNKSDYSETIHAVEILKRVRYNRNKVNELKLGIGKCEMCERPVFSVI